MITYFIFETAASEVAVARCFRKVQLSAISIWKQHG